MWLHKYSSKNVLSEKNLKPPHTAPSRFHLLRINFQILWPFLAQTLWPKNGPFLGSKNWWFWSLFTHFPWADRAHTLHFCSPSLINQFFDPNFWDLFFSDSGKSSKILQIWKKIDMFGGHARVNKNRENPKSVKMT